MKRVISTASHTDCYLIKLVEAIIETRLGKHVCVTQSKIVYHPIRNPENNPSDISLASDRMADQIRDVWFSGLFTTIPRAVDGTVQMEFTITRLGMNSPWSILRVRIMTCAGDRELGSQSTPIELLFTKRGKFHIPDKVHQVSWSMRELCGSYEMELAHV